MKYALLIYSNANAANLSEDAYQALAAEYNAVGATPGIVGGAELHAADTATTVRVANGETLTTDGPFAETKEALGGFYLFDAANLDDAIAVAARIPAARLGGAVEVRPLVER